MSRLTSYPHHRMTHVSSDAPAGQQQQQEQQPAQEGGTAAPTATATAQEGQTQPQTAGTSVFTHSQHKPT